MRCGEELGMYKQESESGRYFSTSTLQYVDIQGNKIG